jgi:hypothetical protein
MLRSLVLLAVVCLAAADDQILQGVSALAEPRLAASGIRIGLLEKTIKSLKQQIEDSAKIDPKGFINEINARLDQIEKPPCGGSKKDLRCGRYSAECVSSLLLCDGKEDCHNGWDERESTCSPGPIKAGNVFSGTATWTSCRLRKDHPVKLQIVAVKKAKFFGARLGVRAEITVDFVEDDHHAQEYEVKGYYVYGKKALVLVPLDSNPNHLGAICRWNHGDDERAECKLVSEGSLNECASFFVSHQD